MTLIKAAERLLSDATTTPVDIALFEPRMRDRQGHFAACADALGSVGRSLGQSLEVFHNSSWNGPAVGGWHPLFPIDDHLVGAGRPVDSQALAAYRVYLSNALELALSSTAANVAIFPTARFLTLPGIADAVVASDKVRGVIIGVMETFPVPDCADQQLVESTFEDAARIFAENKLPYLLVAESAPIGAWLAERGFDAQNILLAPYPAADRFGARAARDLTRSMPLRCGAFGAARPVQNPGLQAAFLSAHDQDNQLWTVRLDLDAAADALGIPVATLSATLNRRNIQSLPSHLDQAAYDQALASQDLMLLPYGERYNTIGSGIFLECLCAGVIPLVPAASTMGQLYLELGGAAPLIHRLDLDGIATCLSECEARLEELKQNSLSVRETWLDHPMGPRQWQARIREKLLAW